MALANDRIAVLENEVEELEAEIEECVPTDTPGEAVASWLERQSVLGFITAEGKKVVEELLRDL